MRVVIGGYVPEEGRVSIMRTAHSIARHAAPFLAPGHEIRLADPRGGDHVQPVRSPKWVKLEKRLLAPARRWFGRDDVIHLIDNDHAYGIAPWNFRRTVVTCHDLMPFLLDPTLESVFGSPLGRYFYRRTVRNLAKCAHVACVSEFTRQTLLEISDCDADRASVIPQAVETHFRPVDRADFSLVAFQEKYGIRGKCVILHVGSCLPYKNITGLLEVFRCLLAEGRKDTVLLKIGGQFSPSDENYLDAHGLRPQLRHLTNLPEEELVLAYNAADLLLWPSRFEGFGLPALEAMACGAPVVCSNGGALPEVVGEVARVHAPEDTDGLTASCRAVLDDAELAAAMGAAGRQHARAFTWERAAESYCELYRRVAAGR